jgi:Ca2+-binding EF-hand superfamily protein/uncharacterized protein YkwD
MHSAGGETIKQRIDKDGIQGPVTIESSSQQIRPTNQGSGSGGFHLERSSLTAEALVREFKAADRNADGMLDLEELKDLIRRAGGASTQANLYATQFFALADTNNDGYVSFAEFMAEFHRMQIFRMVMAFQSQFRSVDTNHDGQLQKSEVLDALSSQIGSWTAVELVDSLFAEVDVDHSGTITMQELNDWYFKQEAEAHQRREAGKARRNEQWRCGQCHKLNDKKLTACSSCRLQVQSVSGSSSGSSTNWVSNIDEAVRIATANNKMIYCHIGRAACGNCVAMKRYYPKLDWSNFVMVDVNVDTERWFYSRYGIQGGSLPFIVVARPNNEKLTENNGYADQKTLERLLASATAKFGGSSQASVPSSKQKDGNEGDFDRQVARARRENKLLYLHIGREQCGNCAAMKRFYPDLDWSSFIKVNLSCDGPDFGALYTRYRLSGGQLPFIVIAKPDQNNTVVSSSNGYQTKQRIQKMLADAAGGTGSDSKRAPTKTNRKTNEKKSGGQSSNSALTGSGNTIEENLAAHNTYRERHHAPPLTWSVHCQETAQKWAEYLAETGKFEHGGHDGMGQNLAMSTGRLTGIQSTKMWYDEIRNPGYDFNDPGFGHGTGHFTQVVWKGSRELGVGIARGKRGTFVVAHYNPPGNYMNMFRRNVLPE